MGAATPVLHAKLEWPATLFQEQNEQMLLLLSLSFILQLNPKLQMYHTNIAIKTKKKCK